MRRIPDRQAGAAPAMQAAQAAAAGIVRIEDRLRMIERSHRRSAAYGLREDDVPDFSRAGSGELAQQLEKNRTLYAYAQPVMETLYEQIENTHSVVILTDADGLVLHARGDDDFLEKAEKVAIRPGALWSEQSKGTNAIGTTLAERTPTLVHGDEHFISANRILTCSAAPIFDHQGRVLGVLDVTGDRRSYHLHTMALVRMSAQMIENQLFAASFRDALTLHFHSHAELIGTLMEGLVSFDRDGRFLSANRTALFKLGLAPAELQSHTLESLFGLAPARLLDLQRGASGFLDLRLHTGVRVFVRAEFRPEPRLPGTGGSVPAARAGAGHGLRLHDLDSGDERVAAAIAKVRKVAGRDIPVLITGETGTGKDWFAQAIHNDSPCAAGPFVAVNCASIPETLIESELFGYEDGAFTGARKNGSSGKLLQADGGTLFLDEIGDMPLPLQARLLRVLQDRVVTPLGSARAIPVRISLVCATNRNLREMIAQGRFREDLYYRLNGLTLRLPALRERSDLDLLVQSILAAEGRGRRCTLAPQTLQLLRSAPWPGNLRQLANLLRTAVAMADDDREIRPEHLPDDFIEEVGSPLPPSRDPAAPVRFDGTLGTLEVSVIRKTLDAHRGNVSATARALGISRNTIYRRLNLR